MIYLLLVPLYLGLAFYTLFDAGKRNEKKQWKVLAFLIGPISFPFYLANRKLLEGETRNGGKTWNTCKYMIPLIWIYFAFSAIDALFFSTFINDYPELSEIEVVQIAKDSYDVLLVSQIILFTILTIILLVIGLLFRDKNLIEEGPTDI